MPGNDTIVQILKTYHSGHGGKLSLARVLAGTLKDSAILHTADGGDARVGGIFALRGQTQTKLADAHLGDTVALGRLEGVVTGDMLSSSKKVPAKPKIEETLTPVYRLAIEAADRKDEVKLTAAIAKLREEDPSLHLEQNAELQEMARSKARGEIHLRVAVDRLQNKYGLGLNTSRPLRALQGNNPQRSRSAWPPQSARAAVTDSSATSSSTSSHCRAEATSLSSIRSRAAWCRDNGFHRWKKSVIDYTEMRAARISRRRRVGGAHRRFLS